ncbi:hypothetical protein [Nonomuraea endophytica]|uniref:Uncharacterized protein n=1 Tax=Nonomuraea endophytica TaxID=714136 RepID=A0A7W8A2E9_9ACTN|nr:hypothetical protein [Nonomuraea endophytica]MBB5077630.1 hypothetical protein [Nonomuraea endophytica]
MRFVSRILIGAAAATMVAVAAPAVASAATATAPATSSTASPYFDADWGPYFSSDHKSKAEGHVSVDKKAYKFWYWKTFHVKKQVCWKDKHGNKHCKWVVEKVKKKVWKWKHDYFYTVDSTLTNTKWWGGKKCAWETFKVVGMDGSTSFKNFRNCTKNPKHYSFSGKNAAHIYVDVSRGGFFGPKSHHSGWQPVYHFS